jgi:hypothetical protein
VQCVIDPAQLNPVSRAWNRHCNGSKYHSPGAGRVSQPG